MAAVVIAKAMIVAASPARGSGVGGYEGLLCAGGRSVVFAKHMYR